MQQNKKQKTVAVIFGGPSFEHEISVLTGVFVLNVLKRSEYDILPVYVDEEGDFYTSPNMYDVKNFTKEHKKGFKKIIFVRGGFCFWGKRLKTPQKIDCAFNCCHGGWGEGGGICALMEICGIPFVAPNSALSGVFMDKLLSKPLIAGMGISFVRYTALTEEAFLEDKQGEIEKIEEKMGYPVIVKPARLGSSIGVGVAQERQSLLQAISTAFSFDCHLLIEEYLPNKIDVNCAAYAANGQVFVSACEQPFSKESIFSFEEKYLSAEKVNPQNGPQALPPAVEEEIKSITERLYKQLHFTGMVRVDFLLHNGKVYFNEMNTVPGSLAYYLFTKKISQARKLFCALIEEGMQTFARQHKKLMLTGILERVKTVKIPGVQK